MSGNFENYLYTKVFPQKPPETIFHYTTQKGILGIIENKEMWATQIHFLNDQNEIHLTFKLLDEELDKQIAKNEVPKVRNLFKRIKGYLQLIDQNHICISSFCKEGDLLSQWRGYGNQGKGYAIGFDLKSLSRIAKNENFVLWPCVYDTYLQHELVAYLVDNWAKKFASSNLNDKNILGEIDLDVCRIAPILKDESFSEEKEWRLISSMVSHKSPRFAFRAGQYSLIPYYNFPISDDISRTCIDSIVIGPSPHMELALNSLETFLASQGISRTKITNSKIPFRNWK